MKQYITIDDNHMTIDNNLYINPIKLQTVSICIKLCQLYRAVWNCISTVSSPAVIFVVVIINGTVLQILLPYQTRFAHGTIIRTGITCQKILL